jgi:hypothetical protein
MRRPLAPERLKRILFKFDIHEFTRHRTVPGGYKYYSSKIGAIHRAPLTQTTPKILTRLQKLMETNSLNKTEEMTSSGK